MISGNLEAKLTAGAIFGAVVLVALAAFVLLPAGLIALLNRSERGAIERLKQSGVRCQVFVKSYRRVSMTQHRVLFDLHLPEGRVGREYMLSGLSDADLANWTALEVPLMAHAHATAATIALDAAPPPAAGRSFFPLLLAVSCAAALLAGLVGAALHSDDEAALQPELRALCEALRGQQIDVANARISPKRPSGVTQRVWVELDGDPYDMQLYTAVAATKPTGDCLLRRAVELCPGSNSRTGYNKVAMSKRVRAAFAAYGK